MPEWLPWPNAMLLMLPFIAWNVALTPLLPSTFPNDDGVPRVVLATEAVTRIAVFAGPALLSFGWDTGTERSGLALYGVGLAVYGAAWLPHLLDRPWATRPAAALAPYVTPALVLCGIALTTESWWYAAAATAFVVAHTAHGWTAWRPRW